MLNIFITVLLLNFNVSFFIVDWAALAQQWIKMKETSIPPAPPPPSIANELQCLSSNNGGGEAPMDMDTKDDDIPPAPPAPNISGTGLLFYCKKLDVTRHIFFF